MEKWKLYHCAIYLRRIKYYTKNIKNIFTHTVDKPLLNNRVAGGFFSTIKIP